MFLQGINGYICRPQRKVMFLEAFVFSGGGWADPPLEADLRVLTSSGGHCSGWYASYWNAFLLEITSKLRKSKKMSLDTYIMKLVRPKYLQENSYLEQVHLGQLFRKKQPVLRWFCSLITVGYAWSVLCWLISRTSMRHLQLMSAIQDSRDKKCHCSPFTGSFVSRE